MNLRNMPMEIGSIMISITRFSSQRGKRACLARRWGLGALAWPAILVALLAGPVNATTLEKTLGPGGTLVSVPLEPSVSSPTAVFSKVPEPLDLYAYKSGNLVSCDDPSFGD